MSSDSVEAVQWHKGKCVVEVQCVEANDMQVTSAVQATNVGSDSHSEGIRQVR